MQEIIDWLNAGCDFVSGAELYQKYGKDMRLKRFTFVPHNSGIASYKEKLKNELAKIAGIDLAKWKPAAKQPEKLQPSPEKIRKIQSIIDPVKSLRRVFPKIEYGKLPDSLKILTMDRITLFHQANAARRRWFEAQSDSERLGANSEEITCRRENLMIWEELYHFNKTGEILGKHPRFRVDSIYSELQHKSKAELFQMLTNLPSYRSKVNKAIASLTDETDLARKMRLLEKYDEQEKAIRKLLEL